MSGLCLTPLAFFLLRSKSHRSASRSLRNSTNTFFFGSAASGLNGSCLISNLGPAGLVPFAASPGCGSAVGPPTGNARAVMPASVVWLVPSCTPLAAISSRITCSASSSDKKDGRRHDDATRCAAAFPVLEDRRDDGHGLARCLGLAAFAGLSAATNRAVSASRNKPTAPVSSGQLRHAGG